MGTITVVSTDGIPLSDDEFANGVVAGKALAKHKKQGAMKPGDITYISKRMGAKTVVLAIAEWRFTLVSYYSIWTNSPPAWHYKFRYPRTHAGVLNRTGMFVLLDAADEAEATGVLLGQPGLYGTPPMPDPYVNGTVVDQSFGLFPPFTPEGAVYGTFVGTMEATLHNATWYISPSGGAPYSYPLYVPLNSSYEPAVFRLTISDGTPDELHVGEVLIGGQALHIYEGNYNASNIVGLRFQCPTPRGGYALTLGGPVSGEVVIIERNSGGVWEIIFRMSIPPSDIAWHRSSVMRSLDPDVAGVLFTYNPSGPHTYTAIRYSADGTTCATEDWAYMDAEIRAYAEIISPGWYDLVPAYPSRKLCVYDGHLVWARRVLMADDYPIVLYWEFCDAAHPDAETFLVEKLGMNYATRGSKVIPSTWSDDAGTYDNFREVGGNRWAFARYTRHLTA